jgi:5-methylcytosine-specific restriction endonuclease McrA
MEKKKTYNNRPMYDLGERPKCQDCKRNTATFREFSKKDGRPMFHRTCSSCRKGGSSQKQRVYKEAMLRKAETMTCEKCGFKAEHICQLDVDHIDGNHKNNDPSNHQILCANCHRLKTHIERDYANQYTP